MEEFGTWAANTILDMIKDPTGPRAQARVVPLEVIERDTTKN
jgi:DNA-binding LacI/PurR family transcriptional regulator